MLLNDHEKEILEILLSYYKSHFMDLNKLIRLLTDAPNLNNIRMMLEKSIKDKPSDKEVERALELVSHIHRECPNVSVMVNCAINTDVFKVGTGPFKSIGNENILINHRDMMLQPFQKGKTKVIFRHNLLDKSLGKEN